MAFVVSSKLAGLDGQTLSVLPLQLLGYLHDELDLSWCPGY